MRALELRGLCLIWKELTSIYEHIRTGVIAKSGGWYAFTTSILKTLKCSMAAICLSIKIMGFSDGTSFGSGTECNAIQLQLPPNNCLWPLNGVRTGHEIPLHIARLDLNFQILLQHGNHVIVTGKLLLGR
jgi:hypothetical protein